MSLKKLKPDSKKVSTVKEKLREKIYDVVYNTSFKMVRNNCYAHDTSDKCYDGCWTLQGQSALYDKLIKVLENAGINLDKAI
jgi:Leu/Phe-tRNA-protein transferase